ncbi:MAG: hypothetical protein FVQ77_10570 [Cytophagales bacterium]|nr:hypothetical protein [Cytophagales bacterium]
MKKSDTKLIILFFAIAFTILFRVFVEETGYISPDSEYYLECAQNLVDGVGFYMSFEDRKVFFSAWPVGYPVMIFLFSKLTGLNVFWSSKCLNIFFIGLCFLFFRKLFKEKSWFIGLIFCAFTFMEIFSYTWSEAPFIFGLLWLCVSIDRVHGPATIGGAVPFVPCAWYKNYWLFSIFFSCTFLFLCRYIGIFSFGVVGSIGIYFIIKKQYKASLQLIAVCLLLIMLTSLYLYNNYLHTGHLFGAERIAPTESNLELTLMLLKAQINEFFIIRNYYFKDYFDIIFIITALFQITLFVFIFLKYIFKKETKFKLNKNDHLTITFFLVGCSYWVIVVILRWFMPFDQFNYRILGPATFMFLLTIISYLINGQRKALYSKISKYIVLLFIISLLHSLPKMYIYKKIVTKVYNCQGKSKKEKVKSEFILFF